MINEKIYKPVISPQYYMSIKKSAAGILTKALILGSILYGYSQDKNTSEKNNDQLSYFADFAGNRNGTADSTEIENLSKMLKENGCVYVLTQGPSAHYEPWSLSNKLYSSKKALKNDHNKSGTRGLVGILRINSNGNVDSAWCSGGNISKNPWIQDSIPNINYNYFKNKQFELFK